MIKRRYDTEQPAGPHERDERERTDLDDQRTWDCFVMACMAGGSNEKEAVAKADNLIDVRRSRQMDRGPAVVAEVAAVDWLPKPGSQTDFLSHPAFEVLYGWGPGGGKTDALIVSAIRNVGRGYGSECRSAIFRSRSELVKSGLVRRTAMLYPMLGGIYSDSDRTWRFPEGETVELRAVNREFHDDADHDDLVQWYAGSEWSFVGIDEVTQFKESQYQSIVSRCRSGSGRGPAPRVRATSNGEGITDAPGTTWVKRHWAPWLDGITVEKPRVSGETLDGRSFVAISRHPTPHVVVP